MPSIIANGATLLSICSLLAGASSLTCWYDSRAALFCDWDPGRDLVEAPCQLEILSKNGFCDRWVTGEAEEKQCHLTKM